MMKRAIRPTIVLLLCLFFAAIVALAGIPLSTERGLAAQEGLTVKQTGDVYYRARSYVGASKTFFKFSEDAYENDLFDSLTFSFDGEPIEVSPEDVRFSTLMAVKKPGQYSDTIYVSYLGEEYETNVDFIVRKKSLVVSALINGRTELTIREGESYTTSVRYEGFVSGEDETDLDAPAIITEQPKMPAEGYRIVPKLAKSDNYEFEYRAAILNVTPNPIHNMTIIEDGKEVLILTGNFSPYYTIQYKDIGVSAASVEYTKTNDEIDRYFGTNSIFDNYVKSDCFSVDLYLDGATVDLTDNTTVSVLLKSRLQGKSSYRVIHVPSDGGEPEIINAVAREGYLTFSTVGLGHYVILCPVEGINIKLIIGIVIGILAIGALGILFGALFRRKY